MRHKQVGQQLTSCRSREAELAGKRGLCRDSSANMQPSDHTSMAAAHAWCKTTCGGTMPVNHQLWETGRGSMLASGYAMRRSVHACCIQLTDKRGATCSSLRSKVVNRLAGGIACEGICRQQGTVL